MNQEILLENIFCALLQHVEGGKCARAICCYSSSSPSSSPSSHSLGSGLGPHWAYVIWSPKEESLSHVILIPVHLQPLVAQSCLVFTTVLVLFQSVSYLFILYYIYLNNSPNIGSEYL